MATYEVRIALYQRYQKLHPRLLVSRHMATRHVFAPHAALIPLLHAARFPHETIIGCLLGTQTSLSSTTLNDDPKASTSREIRYEHAVPLLHHWTGLSAAIEMSLTLVSLFLRIRAQAFAGPQGVSSDNHS